MLKDLLSESEFPEFIHDLFGEEWEEQARAKGHAEGLAEGLALARDSIRLALEARFGPLDDALIHAIGDADTPTLQAVLAIAATGPLEQIRARLGLK